MVGAVEVQRSRRFHSAQFKAQVVQACKPGVSIAAVALAHGLNANLVRRWLKASEGGHTCAVALKTPQGSSAVFVPVQLESPNPPATDIRLELRRGAAAATISWPAEEAAACGRWLREWLG